MRFDYLKIYENVIPKEYCEHIIKEFEDSPTEHLYRNIDSTVRFTELNVNRSNKWEGLVYYMLDVCNQHIAKYKKDFDIKEFQFPKRYGFEEIRIKRYLPNDYDEFKLHVDVCDLESSKRHISFLYYLNDVEHGGETAFGNPVEFSIPPKTGNLLMFPPLWTYVHAGRKPISGPKYIMTTYINYV